MSSLRRGRENRGTSRDSNRAARKSTESLRRASDSFSKKVTESSKKGTESSKKGAESLKKSTESPKLKSPFSSKKTAESSRRLSEPVKRDSESTRKTFKTPKGGSERKKVRLMEPKVMLKPLQVKPVVATRLLRITAACDRIVNTNLSFQAAAVPLPHPVITNTQSSTKRPIKQEPRTSDNLPKKSPASKPTIKCKTEPDLNTSDYDVERDEHVQDDGSSAAVDDLFLDKSSTQDNDGTDEGHDLEKNTEKNAADLTEEHSADADTEKKADEPADDISPGQQDVDEMSEEHAPQDKTADSASNVSQSTDEPADFGNADEMSDDDLPETSQEEFAEEASAKRLKREDDEACSMEEDECEVERSDHHTSDNHTPDEDIDDCTRGPNKFGGDSDKETVVTPKEDSTDMTIDQSSDHSTPEDDDDDDTSDDVTQPAVEAPKCTSLEMEEDSQPSDHESPSPGVAVSEEKFSDSSDFQDLQDISMKFICSSLNIEAPVWVEEIDQAISEMAKQKKTPRSFKRIKMPRRDSEDEDCADANVDEKSGRTKDDDLDLSSKQSAKQSCSNIATKGLAVSEEDALEENTTSFDSRQQVLQGTLKKPISISSRKRQLSEDTDPEESSPSSDILPRKRLRAEDADEADCGKVASKPHPEDSMSAGCSSEDSKPKTHRSFITALSDFVRGIDSNSAKMFDAKEEGESKTANLPLPRETDTFNADKKCKELSVESDRDEIIEVIDSSSASPMSLDGESEVEDKKSVDKTCSCDCEKMVRERVQDTVKQMEQAIFGGSILSTLTSRLDALDQENQVLKTIALKLKENLDNVTKCRKEELQKRPALVSRGTQASPVKLTSIPPQLAGTEQQPSDPAQAGHPFIPANFRQVSSGRPNPVTVRVQPQQQAPKTATSTTEKPPGPTPQPAQPPSRDYIHHQSVPSASQQSRSVAAAENTNKNFPVTGPVTRPSGKQDNSSPESSSAPVLSQHKQVSGNSDLEFLRCLVRDPAAVPQQVSNACIVPVNTTIASTAWPASTAAMPVHYSVAQHPSTVHLSGQRPQRPVAGAIMNYLNARPVAPNVNVMNIPHRSYNTPMTMPRPRHAMTPRGAQPHANRGSPGAQSMPPNQYVQYHQGTVQAAIPPGVAASMHGFSQAPNVRLSPDKRLITWIPQTEADRERGSSVLATQSSHPVSAATSSGQAHFVQAANQRRFSQHGPAPVSAGQIPVSSVHHAVTYQYDPVRTLSSAAAARASPTILGRSSPLSRQSPEVLLGAMSRNPQTLSSGPGRPGVEPAPNLGVSRHPISSQARPGQQQPQTRSARPERVDEIRVVETHKEQRANTTQPSVDPRVAMEDISMHAVSRQTSSPATRPASQSQQGNPPRPDRSAVEKLALRPGQSLVGALQKQIYELERPTPSGITIKQEPKTPPRINTTPPRMSTTPPKLTTTPPRMSTTPPRMTTTPPRVGQTTQGSPASLNLSNLQARAGQPNSSTESGDHSLNKKQSSEGHGATVVNQEKTDGRSSETSEARRTATQVNAQQVLSATKPSMEPRQKPGRPTMDALLGRLHSKALLAQTAQEKATTSSVASSTSTISMSSVNTTPSVAMSSVQSGLVVNQNKSQTEPTRSLVNARNNDATSLPSSVSGIFNNMLEPPSKPTIFISQVNKHFSLKWDMMPSKNHAPVEHYQLFSFFPSPPKWIEIGVVKALPLPMACTLTELTSGGVYNFAVRGVDKLGRAGEISDLACVVVPT